MNPTISIIIPTLNSAQTLAACLNSIINQTYKNKEVLLIDGVSTDETLSIIKEYQKTYPYVKYVSAKDKSVYDAMNKGIDMAEGDFLFFLGSDDAFYSTTILEEVFCPDNDGYDFIYGNVFFKNRKAVYSGESSIEKLIGEQISICHQAIFYKKNIFESIGKYDLKYFIHADYDLNVKCFESSVITKKYINKIITLYNEQGISGMSPNKDHFHDHLTLHYITKYSSPFNLILKLKDAQQELEGIKKSASYKIAKVLSSTFQKIKNTKHILSRK